MNSLSYWNEKFLFIGFGQIAKQHFKTITSLGGEVCGIYDPVAKSLWDYKSAEEMMRRNYKAKWVVICANSDKHLENVEIALKYCKHIVCEKPLCMPWEKAPDDNRINIVLQLRYLTPDFLYAFRGDGVPMPGVHPVYIDAQWVRDEKYFNSWKGDERLTGGIFSMLFIHYIDLAERWRIGFRGKVVEKGEQYRKVVYSNGEERFIEPEINDICYTLMYKDILEGGGVKPKNILRLNWLLEHANILYGTGREILNTVVELDYSVGKGFKSMLCQENTKRTGGQTKVNWQD